MEVWRTGVWYNSRSTCDRESNHVLTSYEGNGTNKGGNDDINEYYTIKLWLLCSFLSLTSEAMALSRDKDVDNPYLERVSTK
mmetsp:Transcript_1983/g.3059  ORF Transcript_1983/g.3059 Transcript_1983/m.3059 type:complete len:82 (-) Transcript_1983:339-584(-)